MKRILFIIKEVAIAAIASIGGWVLTKLNKEI